MHTQMYMLEGGSRWNMKRTQEALDTSRRSHTKLYDVHLMSNLNSMSNRVLGHALLPEFIPPGCPTGTGSLCHNFHKNTHLCTANLLIEKMVVSVLYD